MHAPAIPKAAFSLLQVKLTKKMNGGPTLTFEIVLSESQVSGLARRSSHAQARCSLHAQAHALADRCGICLSRGMLQVQVLHDVPLRIAQDTNELQA